MQIDNLCTTCLSVDRKLVPVNDVRDNAIYSYYFNKLTIKDINICWECQALFKKMYKFKAQVMHAQHAIYSWMDQKAEQIPSLSSLSITTKTSYDEVYEYLHVKIETNTDLEISNKDDDHFHEDWCDTAYIDIQNIGANATTNHWATSKHLTNKNKQKIHTSNTNDSSNKTKSNVTCFDIDDVKSEDVANNKNKKRTYRVAKQSYNKDKFIVFKLSEEEMLKNREKDRDARRYKACTFKCEKCIMGYYDEQKYERHVKEKHSDEAGKHVCPICEVRVSRAEYYRQHVSAHYRGYRCKLCARAHHRLSAALIHHATEHERETKYICVVCEKIFDNKRSLRYHRDKAHREPPRCQLCDKTFSSNASLKTHISTHTTSAATHRCLSCSRTYKSMASLRAHMRTHSSACDERAYCAPCDTQFRDVRLYARHLAEHRAHVDARALKYSCAQCEARFVNKSYLQRHVRRAHLKIYPHACALCHKRFAARDRLKSHILEKHEGVPRPKDKICSYCGKGFAKRSTLTNHVRVHTGERPFSCALCAASFAQKSALSTHARALHAHVTSQPPRTTT